MYKAIMDELIIEVATYSNDDWRKKMDWNRRVWLILFDEVKIDVVKIAFTNCFDVKNVVLRVMEGSRWVSFIQGPKKASIQIEGT